MFLDVPQTFIIRREANLIKSEEHVNLLVCPGRVRPIARTDDDVLVAQDGLTVLYAGVTTHTLRQQHLHSARPHFREAVDHPCR